MFEDVIHVVWDAFHLAAIILLPYKLHTSRSAVGVSLKMQQLYLLVHLTRFIAICTAETPWFDYDGAMEITKLALTAVTIGMMRRRPSLRASYDVSLDHFRSWAFGIIPAFAMTLIILALECSNSPYGVCLFHDVEAEESVAVALVIFSHALEPFAIVPQLLLFRGCTDAGRLTVVYISLMGVYRALVICVLVTMFFVTYLGEESGRSSSSPSPHTSGSNLSGILFFELMVSSIQTVTLVVFLVDWRLRVSRRSPPDETGYMMEPKSAAREPLLTNQNGKDDYSGGDESASRFGVAGDGGTVGAEGRRSLRRQQGSEIVDRIEGVLLRERGQEQVPPQGAAASAAAAASDHDGDANGGGDGAYLV